MLVTSGVPIAKACLDLCDAYAGFQKLVAIARARHLPAAPFARAAYPHTT